MDRSLSIAGNQKDNGGIWYLRKKKQSKKEAKQDRKKLAQKVARSFKADFLNELP